MVFFVSETLSKGKYDSILFLLIPRIGVFFQWCSATYHWALTATWYIQWRLDKTPLNRSSYYLSSWLIVPVQTMWFQWRFKITKKKQKNKIIKTCMRAPSHTHTNWVGLLSPLCIADFSPISAQPPNLQTLRAFWSKQLHMITNREKEQLWMSFAATACWESERPQERPDRSGWGKVLMLHFSSNLKMFSPPGVSLKSCRGKASE